MRPLVETIDKVVYDPAKCVRARVRWGSLFKSNYAPAVWQKLYFDVWNKGTLVGFRIGIDDINLDNPSELIKDYSRGLGF